MLFLSTSTPMTHIRINISSWYINRRGPQTRLGKLREEYIQREKQYMVEAMMKKKNVSQKQFDEYYDGIINKSDSKTEEISIIRSEADKKYRDIINKLLAADHTDEYVMTILIS